MIRSLTIIEIQDNEITADPCGLMTAFRYMVEDVESKTRWFGSNTKQDCVDYIADYNRNQT